MIQPNSTPFSVTSQAPASPSSRLAGDVASTPAPCRVALTQGHIALIDQQDSDLASVRWRADVRGERVYAVRQPGRHKMYLHRLILERKLGREIVGGELADHINGDGLDCRRSNLRSATPAENAINSRLSRRNTSGVKGVRRQRSGWRAYVALQHIGCFKEFGDAVAARRAAALALYGEFAREAQP